MMECARGVDRSGCPCVALGLKISRGEMQTPHQTVAVQVLRSTRFFEEIARARSKPTDFRTHACRTPLAEIGSGGEPIRAGARLFAGRATAFRRYLEERINKMRNMLQLMVSV